MVGDDELYAAQSDTVDLMRLVGADGYPKRRLYASHAHALVRAFIEARGYDEHDAALLRPALMGLLHEEAAAHPTSWRRVFPPPTGVLAGVDTGHDPHEATGTAGHDAGRASRPSARAGFMGALATDLDDATASFLGWLERSAVARKIVQEARSNDGGTLVQDADDPGDSLD